MELANGDSSFERAVAIVRGEAPNLHLLGKALKAVDYLIDHDLFVEGNKKQFALKMGWVKEGGKNGVDQPNERLVEDVCNLTRDQHLFPEYREALSGMVIAYRPNQGGFVLVDPDGATDSRMLIHVLLGDMQRQQSIKTMNSRRIPTWRAVGDSFSKNDDLEMARLMWQAENEIQSSGFVSGTLVGQIYKTAGARGLL